MNSGRQTGETSGVSISDNECYIRNDAAIAEILRNVRDGHYCAVLGPHYREKSLLLKDVKTELKATGDEVCVLLNLQEPSAIKDGDFLRAFAEMVGHRVREESGIANSLPLIGVVGEQSIQHFLQDYVQKLKKDLVLLLDHLEKIWTGPLESLLRALRAIFTGRNPNDPYRLVVVAASSLSVAKLYLGPISPFNIAHPVWVRDLKSPESKRLIKCILAQKNIHITPAGEQRLIEATAGDRYLIRKLCNLIATQAVERGLTKVSAQRVNEAIDRLVEEEAAPAGPLRATVHALEDNPVMLMNTLVILNHGRTPQRQLKLDIKNDVVDLELTGAIRVDDEAGEKVCLVRNEIYDRYLKKHFHPERVVHILSMAGDSEEAIRYLEKLIADKPRYRSTLLGAVVDSIYAAQSEPEAYGWLAQRLRRAFSIPKVRCYFVNPELSKLKLVSQVGFDDESIGDLPLKQKDEPEVKAYFSQHYEVSQGDAGEQTIFVPIMRDDGERLGLTAIQGFEADPLSDDFLELLAFLKQVGRAIGNVMERERKLRQLMVLHETGKRITSSLDLIQAMEATVKAAIEAVPGAQRAALFLWDERKKKLHIVAHRGYRATITEEIELGKGEGYAGRVFASGEPILIDDVQEDPRVYYKRHPEIGKKQKSVICVPLKVWDGVIGVLCVDNIIVNRAFDQDALDLLSTFASQAAIAIHNARLSTELYELGISINRGALDPEEIFQRVRQSIARLTYAWATNMLLLRDTDAPSLSITQKPSLSVAEGLGEDYADNVKPRGDGLTFRVLDSRKPLRVNEPKADPGINDLAYRKGTRACLCLPLMIQNSVIGVLFVHYNKPHDFSDNEINMLSLFANQAALAIENSRQREELTMTKAVAWMGLVFSNVAHGITQKAGAIRNTVWGLRQTLAKDPDIEDRLNRIDEYAQSVREIPGRALLPFQDQAGPLDLNAVLQSEIPRWCHPEDNVLIEFKELSTAPTVNADAKWLAIVLEVTTTNAVRAMRSLSQKKLSVLSEIRGRRVVVEISNSGQEIPIEIRERLFKEPIPKSQGAEGSGVGLLIARTILRHYGGDIELLRTGREGTTFSLWLPLYRASNT